MFRKKKPITNQKSPIPPAIPHNYLVNYSAMKEWPKYSLNRTMSGLKLKTAEDIREIEREREGRKQGRDWNQILTVAIIGVILSVIVITTVPQMLNYTEMNTDITDLSEKLGRCLGESASLREQLSNVKGETPHEILPG